MNAKLWLGLLGVVCAGSVGCAPAHRLEVPTGWPVEWRGRQLYHTPHAYIYATNAAAAGQADRLAERVARDFERRTGARTGKGLMLVTDTQQQPAVPSYLEFCELMAIRSAVDEGRATDEKDLKIQCDSIVAALQEQGIDPESELLMTPLDLQANDLTALMGLPGMVAAEVGWAVALPTNAAIEQANRQIMQGELRRRQVGLLLQVPLSPIIVFEERVRNVKAQVARDVTVFRNLSDRQADWTAARREQYAQEYMDRRLAQELTPVLSGLSDILALVAEPLKPLLPGKQQSGPAAPGPRKEG